MIKKISACLMAVLLLAVFTVGCSNNDADLKIGMVTDTGSVEDSSYNQATWAGVVKAGQVLQLETQWAAPAELTDAAYLAAITGLYEDGCNLIVTPGYLFTDAVQSAREQYPDCRFICIDSTPEAMTENTVSVTFAEHQAGFLAGAAAALQLQEGEFGAVLGMEIPSVQRYNYGFQQGVRYANQALGTNITLKEENFIYAGAFDNFTLGQQFAAQLYDKGVKCIFVSAGNTGSGVITEAKTRCANGTEVWVIGSDVDQISAGIFEGNSSIILTSAIKRFADAAYNMIQSAVDDDFPAGKTVVYDISNSGAGLPTKNANLTQEVMDTCTELAQQIADGSLTISGKWYDGLFK